jgi:hypothetical protein
MCCHWPRCFGAMEKKLCPHYLAGEARYSSLPTEEMYLLRPSRHADMAVASPSTLPTYNKDIFLYISFYCAYVDYFFASSKMEQFETCAEKYAREFTR